MVERYAPGSGRSISTVPQHGNVLAQTAGAALILLIFLVLLGWPLGLGDAVPGALSDSRFNMYVLEHVFRWMEGKVPSFASPDMFYPYPDTLFFSDTHAGTAWIYAMFRLLGLDMYMAYKTWFFTGFALTYVASYYVFLRLGTRSWIAAVGAALFTFNLPIIVQFDHAQLVYRCGVPLAMLSLWQWCQTGRIRLLLQCLFWLNVQMLISVYLGVFLAMLMGLFYLAFLALSPDRFLALRKFRDLRGELKTITARDFPKAAAWIAVAALTIFILHEYRTTGRLYGLSRSWGEIASFLPRPTSYLLSYVVPYYRDLTQPLADSLGLSGEHNIFIGIGTTGLFVAGLFGLRSRPGPQCDATFARVSLVAALLIVLCVTKFGHFSIYRVIGELPGLNAIRAVTRIILILLFPISVVAVKGIEYLRLDGAAPRFRVAICAGLLFIFALEIGGSDKGRYHAGESEARINAIVEQARIRGADFAHPILAVTSLASNIDDDIYGRVDAAFAAQRLGWPTVNGYSGSAVPGSGALDCGMAFRQYRAYRAWDHRLGETADLNDLLRRTVYVGPLPCDQDWQHRKPLRMEVSPDAATPPNVAIAPQVSLSITSAEQRDGTVTFKVDIVNGSQDWMWQNLQKPLRLSWRFAPIEEASQQGAGHKAAQGAWATRQDLSDDIAPGAMESEVIVAPLPKQPGLYRLEVSMIEESAFWFHDKGMKIATWPTPIKVE